jgi:hypothetical protein
MALTVIEGHNQGDKGTEDGPKERTEEGGGTKDYTRQYYLKNKEKYRLR